MFSAQDKKAVIHPLGAPYDHVNKLQEHKELQKIWQPIISAHHHHKIPNIRAMQKHFLGYFTITAQIMPHQYPTALTTVFCMQTIVVILGTGGISVQGNWPCTDTHI